MSADAAVPAASATGSGLLSFVDLEVSFHLATRTVTAVRGVSFSVGAGEIVALVGESGSGKSVTAMSALRLLAEPPATYPGGHILWQGADVLEMTAQRLRRLRGGEIGMIFQEPMTALNPTWTCGRQVEEALELHTDLNAADRRARAIELFSEVGIPQPETRHGQYPHELSGGMRQRICISMALACHPQILIADEPTTALDVTIQAQILDLIKRLQAEQGMGVLFITHDLGVVAELADRVVLMRHGRVVEQGPVAEIFANPSHPYTRGLLACRPRLGSRRERLPTIEDFLPSTPTSSKRGEKPPSPSRHLVERCRRVCAKTASVVSVGDVVSPDDGPPSDHELLGRYCRSRDMEAFRAILDRHQTDLLRMAHALLCDGHAAHDAVQEGFLRLSRDCDQLLQRNEEGPGSDQDKRRTGSLGGWLCTVVRNCCFDLLRRRKSLTTLNLSDGHGSADVSPGQQVTDQETGEALWKAVAGLPPLERAAVVLRYRDGLSYQDIATQLDKTATHIGVLLHQGLGRLRQCSALKAGVLP